MAEIVTVSPEGSETFPYLRHFLIMFFFRSYYKWEKRAFGYDLFRPDVGICSA